MTKQLFIRLSGWALMLGGVLFSWGLIAATLLELRYDSIQGLNGFFDTSILVGIFVLGPPLIGVGLIGFLVRYGNAVGRLGEAVLLVGALAGLLATVFAFLSEAITISIIASDGDYFIAALVAGIMLMFICLALFGILAVRRRVMPRWNRLPIVAGLWFPVLFALPNSWNGGGEYVSYATILMVIVLAVMMVLLGFTLQAVGRENPVIA